MQHARYNRPLSHVHANGFSLIELMVVLFIVGLMAGAVMLSLPTGDQQLRREVEQFSARLLAARDEAIATGSPVAVTVNQSGYYFEQRRTGQWQTYPTGAFALQYWEQGTLVARANSNGKPTTARERLVLDSVGLASSDLSLSFSRDGKQLQLAVSRAGEVRLAN